MLYKHQFYYEKIVSILRITLTKIDFTDIMHIMKCDFYGYFFENEDLKILIAFVFGIYLKIPKNTGIAEKNK